MSPHAYLILSSGELAWPGRQAQSPRPNPGSQLTPSPPYPRGCRGASEGGQNPTVESGTLRTWTSPGPKPQDLTPLCPLCPHGDHQQSVGLLRKEASKASTWELTGTSRKRQAQCQQSTCPQQPQHGRRDLTGLPDSLQRSCVEGVMDRSLLAPEVFQATAMALNCKYLEARNRSRGAEMEGPGTVSSPRSFWAPECEHGSYSS